MQWKLIDTSRYCTKQFLFQILFNLFNTPRVFGTIVVLICIHDRSKDNSCGYDYTASNKGHCRKSDAGGHSCNHDSCPSWLGRSFMAQVVILIPGTEGPQGSSALAPRQLKALWICLQNMPYILGHQGIILCFPKWSPLFISFQGVFFFPLQLCLQLSQEIHSRLRVGVWKKVVGS